MSDIMLAACQLEEEFGELTNTVDTVLNYSRRAETAGAHLICFPECFLQGYKLELDFVKVHAVETTSATFNQLLNRLAELEIVIVLGFMEKNQDRFYNSAAVIHRGALKGVYRKQSLMRSEESLFASGSGQKLYTINGLKFCVAICKDLNLESVYQYPKSENADLLVAPCNNMLLTENAYLWEHKHNEIRQQQCKHANIPLLTADVTGLCAGKLALGPTGLIGANGEIIQQLPTGSEDLFLSTLS